MTPLQIITLATEVGWPLAEKLIDLWANGNEEVSPDEWESLKARVNKPFEYLAGDRPEE